jgi:hypothetical protein
MIVYTNQNKVFEFFQLEKFVVGNRTGTISSNKLPNRPQALTLRLCQSARECPNFLKKWESTNFDMGFQKKNISSRSEKVDF